MLHAHRRTVFAGDDDASEVFRSLHARLNLNDALLLVGADVAHRQVLVFIAYCSHHLLGCDTKGFQRLWVQIEIDFTLGAPHYGDGADAANIFQAALEVLLGPVGQFYSARGFCGLVAVVRQYGHRPDGACGWVKTQHPRLFHFGAQAGLDSGHFFTHVVSRFASIDVQAELDHHHALAFVAARSQGVDTGDGVDAFLDLFGDFALHYFR